MNHVIATTAVKLSAALKKEVEQTIQSKLGKAAYRLEEVVDPNVLGGIRLQLNSRVYDATIHGKLLSLKEHRNG